MVNANFFSNLVISALGIKESSAQIKQDTKTIVEKEDLSSNSQTMHLFDTSINPDRKNDKSEWDIKIVEGEAITLDGALVGRGLENISSDGIIVYTVKEGDTLSEIAEYYDVSINTIRWENNITGNNIKIDQKLNILPVTGVKHIVKKGDTLDKITNKYDAVLEDILIFNGIDAKDILKEGDILFIPNGTITPIVIQKPLPSLSQNPTLSNSKKITPGYYIRPASGIITSPYGPRRGGYHYGVDIGNKRGTTVIAAASGVVIEVIDYCVEGRPSCGNRYGNYITIEHPNGQRTIYAHLAKIYVLVGESVSQGEKIGTIGNTGRSTGPHLHFQVENSSGSTIRPQF